MFGEFSLWVLLGAAILNFIFGAIWYSQKVFGRIWMDGAGIKEADVNNCGIGVYLAAFLNSFIVSLGMAILLYLTETTTLPKALVVAFFAWLGFVVTSHFSGVLWEKKPLKVFFINIGYSLVSLLLIAAFFILI